MTALSASQASIFNRVAKLVILICSQEEGQEKHFESGSDGEEDPQPHPQKAAKPNTKAKPRAKPAPKPQAPTLASRGHDTYGNLPAMGDTRYVP